MTTESIIVRCWGHFTPRASRHAGRQNTGRGEFPRELAASSRKSNFPDVVRFFLKAKMIRFCLYFNSSLDLSLQTKHIKESCNNCKTFYSNSPICNPQSPMHSLIQASVAMRVIRRSWNVELLPPIDEPFRMILSQHHENRSIFGRTEKKLIG